MNSRFQPGQLLNKLWLTANTGGQNMPGKDQELWLLLAECISGLEVNLDDLPDDDVVCFANLHGITAMLGARAKEGLAKSLGDDSLQKLKIASYALAAQDLVINHSTQTTLQILDNEKIPALLLKGTPMAHLYYPETFYRQRCGDTAINLPTHQ